MLAAGAVVLITVLSCARNPMPPRRFRLEVALIISAVTFTQKAASGIGGLVAGIAIDVIAFPQGAEPGTVAADKVFALGLAVGPGLLGFYFLLLFFLTRYGITRAGHRETLARLAEREATTPG